MLSTEEQKRVAADLAKDKFYLFLEKSYLAWTVALAVALFAVGGLSWLVWGIFVRIVITYHITWLVHSAAHRSGYPSFRPGDKSPHHGFVTFLARGGGWHNNHPAFPLTGA